MKRRSRDQEGERAHVEHSARGGRHPVARDPLPAAHSAQRVALAQVSSENVEVMAQLTIPVPAAASRAVPLSAVCVPSVNASAR